MNEEVETLYLSQYPQLVEVITEVRKEENQPVFFPEIGKEYDGLLVMRCRRTIDPGVYLMVLVDNIMFYVINDIGADLGQVHSL
ncbi:MAG: hypothetical protein M0021_03260 [Clostridia bacterium]|nr:hypothetical protein [Clostridia bacterium]